MSEVLQVSLVMQLIEIKDELMKKAESIEERFGCDQAAFFEGPLLHRIYNALLDLIIPDRDAPGAREREQHFKALFKQQRLKSFDDEALYVEQIIPSMQLQQDARLLYLDAVLNLVKSWARENEEQMRIGVRDIEAQ
ncbi:MAG: hypothetical protein K0Q73_1977 [Paenibacillus sp.]|jgi:hypothetical protein|nr:hypothetical protein [Paenibacillus sp.]